MNQHYLEGVAWEHDSHSSAPGPTVFRYLVRAYRQRRHEAKLVDAQPEVVDHLLNAQDSNIV